MLARLMNAPVALQRTIAIGMLVLVATSIAVAVWIAIGSLSQQHAALFEMREQAGKLAKIASMKDSLSEVTSSDNSQTGQQLFLEAESLTIGRANLQSRIDALAQSNNLILASAGPVPDIDEKGVKLIGLRVDVTGSYEAVQKAILDIETSKPPLLIRELVVRTTAGEAGDRPVELAAQIKIFGAFRPTGGIALKDEPNEKVEP